MWILDFCVLCLLVWRPYSEPFLFFHCDHPKFCLIRNDACLSLWTRFQSEISTDSNFQKIISFSPFFFYLSVDSRFCFSSLSFYSLLLLTGIHNIRITIKSTLSSSSSASFTLQLHLLSLLVIRNLEV